MFMYEHLMNSFSKERKEFQKLDTKMSKKLKKCKRDKLLHFDFCK